MKNIFQAVLLLVSTSCFAQPVLSWQHTYGGTLHEYAWKTIPTSDGGFAFVGDSESNDLDVSGNHGNDDFWVAKVNASGVLQWSFLFGGTEDDFGKDIIQTADGGFMAVGYTGSNDGNVTGHHGTYGNDVWVLKLTSAGALTWAKCFGGTDDDEGLMIVQNTSGDFYIAGSTYSNDGDVSGNHAQYYSDFWVMKMDAAGTLLGQKCIGGSDYEEGICLTLTSDNGCLVGGRTSSTDGDAIGYHGGNDMLIAKLNSSLTVEWSKCYGGTETEECNSVVQLTDGSYAALGYTSTHNNGDVTGHHGAQGSDDFWLLKLTSTGTITWAKCYGGSGDDQANPLTKTTDGGYAMSGLTNSTDGDVSGFHTGFWDPDIWVAKVDASGNLQWQRCCGGSGQDEAFNMFQEASGALVVTGFTYSSDYDITYNRGSADGWILKVTGSAGVNDNLSDFQIDVYPNPATEKIFVNTKEKLQIIIMEVSGKTVFEENDFTGGWLALPVLSDGIYYLGISTEQKSTIRKIAIKK
ncbi:MAG: T9SS type A sorting domain-containing protein [Bacteroidota bacterium]